MPVASGEQVKEDRWIPSSCYMCYNGCAIKVHRVDGVVVKIEGDPDNPHGRGKLCGKGQAGLMELYDEDRLRYPVKRTNPEKGIGVDPGWVRITWDEALDVIVPKMKRIHAEDPRKLILGGLDFQNFLAFWAFASAYGTPNVWKGASDYYCGNGLHPITYMAHAAFYAEPDYHHCNYVMNVGTQMGFMVNTNANPLAQLAADARMRGMKVVQIDPVGSNAAAKADEWVPIKPGTDAALMLGMLNVLLNELNIYDAPFLRKYTNGPYLVKSDGRYVRDAVADKPLVWDAGAESAKPYDDPSVQEYALEGEYTVAGTKCEPAFQLLKNHVRTYTAEKVAEITTVPASTVRRLAREFGEEARVGSTIMVDGVELPYRPACACWNRGAIAHKHSNLHGWAIELLNIVVGAIDVPGGLLGANPVGPFWEPSEGPDGMIMPAEFISNVELCYPARACKDRPETLELRELFPVAPYSSPIFEDAVLNPDKYGLTYKPELWIQVASNAVVSCSNPERMAEVIRKVPFMVYMGTHLDETAELADIVLPDASYLERLVPVPNGPSEWILAGPGEWYWNIQQPVVDPPGEARPQYELFVDLADKVGIRKDYNVMLNTILNLQEPYRLEPEESYSWEQFADIQLKSWFGPEHDLNYFKEHGFYVSRRKKVEEAYPRPFLKPRIPVYLEHFLDAGMNVKEITAGMGIPWDVSDYQALPDWKPCPSYERKGDGYPLYVVNYKLPFHTFSHTTQNPLLDELAQAHPYAYAAMISPQAAKRAGIKDGDKIWVESSAARVPSVAKVTECVHPEVVGVAGTFGAWAKGRRRARGKGLHVNSLMPNDATDFWERFDPVFGALDFCLKAKVYKRD